VAHRNWQMRTPSPRVLLSGRMTNLEYPTAPTCIIKKHQAVLRRWRRFLLSLRRLPITHETLKHPFLCLLLAATGEG